MKKITQLYIRTYIFHIQRNFIMLNDMEMQFSCTLTDTVNFILITKDIVLGKLRIKDLIFIYVVCTLTTG
jgi:hypothetical protein